MVNTPQNDRIAANNDWLNSQIEFIETIKSLDDLLAFADHNPVSHEDSARRWREVVESLKTPQNEKEIEEWDNRHKKARKEALKIEDESEYLAKISEISERQREELIEIMNSSKGVYGKLGFALLQIQARPRPTDIIRRSILMSLVSAYEGLMGATYRELLRGSPGLYMSSGKEFSLAEAVQFGSIEALIEEAIERKVNSALHGGLEDWATTLAKSDINLKDCCLHWDKTVEVFQRRNAHVHTRGRVNPTYLSKVKCGLDVGTPLEIDSEYLKSAISQILTLGCLASLRVWLATHPKDPMLAGAVPYMYYDDLLDRGYWEPVEKIAGFLKGLDFELDLKFSQRSYYWVARKIGRGSKSIASEVARWDTSALKPLFAFEKHVLLGELEEAERIFQAGVSKGDSWVRPPLDTPVVRFDKEASKRLGVI